MAKPVDTRLVQVQLPGGSSVLARAVDVDHAGATGAKKAGYSDQFNFDEVVATLEGLSEAIRASLVKGAPDDVTVELGIELAVKSGKLTALLVEGSAKGSLTVSLGWKRTSPSSATDGRGDGSDSGD